MNGTEKKLVITLASKNEGKRRELCYWLEQSGLPVEIALNTEAADIEETGLDFLENARLKASQTAPVSADGFVLGEDSGMVVDTLDGLFGISPFPGLCSNRWLTPARRDELLGQSVPNRMPLDRTNQDGVTNSDLCHGILTLMQGKSNRTAHYCCSMALWHVERGLCYQTLDTTELSIIDGEPRGIHGFGYDPITVPVDTQALPTVRTMAELSTEEKNRISHRGRAFQKVLQYLQSQGCF